MLAASRGLPIESCHVNTCLMIVFEVAAVNYKDPLTNLKAEFQVNEIKFKQLGNQEIALLKSLSARVAYGGMSCDVFMLTEYIHVWFKRFESNEPIPVELNKEMSTTKTLSYLKPLDTTCSPWLKLIYKLYSNVHQAISFENVGALGSDDFVLSAVDHHCSSIVDVLLRNGSPLKTGIEVYLRSIYGPSVDIPAIIKETIWVFRSSINHKKLLYDTNEYKGDPAGKEKLHGLWVMIKDNLDMFSDDYIRKRFQ